jgi:restriction system protein
VNQKIFEITPKMIKSLLQVFWLLISKLWYIWAIALILGLSPIFLDKLVKSHRIKRARKTGEKWFSDKEFLQQLRKMDPRDFEEYVAELFRELGYNAKAVGRSHDEGVDVIAEKDGTTHYIQCKRYNRKVTLEEVRDFYGTLADKIAKGANYFVTTDSFTLGAEKFAEDKPIELIDGYKLVKYHKMANGNNYK